MLGTEATTPPFNTGPLMIFGFHVILGTASMEKKSSSVKRQVGWRSFTVLFHSWHCCVLAHILSTIFASAGDFFCFVKSCVQFVYQLLGRCAKRKEGLVRSHSPACCLHENGFASFLAMVMYCEGCSYPNCIKIVALTQ